MHTAMNATIVDIVKIALPIALTWLANWLYQVWRRRSSNKHISDLLRQDGFTGEVRITMNGDDFVASTGFKLAPGSSIEVSSSALPNWWDAVSDLYKHRKDKRREAMIEHAKMDETHRELERIYGPYRPKREGGRPVWELSKEDIVHAERRKGPPLDMTQWIKPSRLNDYWMKNASNAQDSPAVVLIRESGVFRVSVETRTVSTLRSTTVTDAMTEAEHLLREAAKR